MNPPKPGSDTPTEQVVTTDLAHNLLKSLKERGWVTYRPINEVEAEDLLYVLAATTDLRLNLPRICERMVAVWESNWNTPRGKE